MKKTYMIPTLKVVKIQPTQLMVNSIPEGTDYDGKTELLSRRARFSDWDEEE
jgi:hypothetical protein